MVMGLHASWACTEQNVRTKATQAIFEYLHGALPRLPDNAVEVYKEMVDQSKYIDFPTDMTRELQRTCDAMASDVEGLRSEVVGLRKRIIAREFINHTKTGRP